MLQIAETRGNDRTYGQQGKDHMAGALHWGPLARFDEYLRTYGVRQSKINAYDSEFHKYTLEWDENYLSICKYPVRKRTETRHR